jgi:hypothetical protein
MLGRQIGILQSIALHVGYESRRKSATSHVMSPDALSTTSLAYLRRGNNVTRGLGLDMMCGKCTTKKIDILTKNPGRSTWSKKTYDAFRSS